ncbi:ABC transporter ATP-binding protein [Clostridium saccharoperbutylacetonicum]
MIFKPFSSKDILLIKRAITYIIPYKFKFIGAFLCIISSIGFGIIQPLIWGNLLTYLFGENSYGVLISLIYILVINVAESGIGFLQSYLFAILSSNIIYDLKRDTYEKILNLPVKAFDEMRGGDFISRMQGDISNIANIITNQVLNTIVDILKVIIIGITVFTISLPLSMVIIASFPITYIIFLKSGKVLRKKNQEIAVINDNYFSTLAQSLSGIREIKSLGIKKQNFNMFLNISKKLKDKTINLGILNTLAQTLSQGINSISQLAVMAFGGYLILNGMLSMQYYIAFSSYSNQFSFALMNITRLNSNIQQVLTSLERVFGLMDNLSYTKECFGDKNIDQIKGEIQFENVSFEYNEDVSVLKNISFKILQNKKIAIVGTSGSGKTTILNLILKFYKPSSGRIFIDGIDINEFSEECLYSHISIVRQEPFLFNMSIKDNLLMANPKAIDEEIYKACKTAYIHDYIMDMPQGYDSIVGENGINLSGGQKQRLAIARALIKNSTVILFDEATSSLDNESQYYIRKAINDLSKNHTVIIIAHRLFTVMEADEIIVIDNGEIAGCGNHGFLIDKNPIYKHLYEAEIDVLKGKEVI